MSSLPSNYLEKIYAGVLGKIIGVYLGRPFENWTYHRILERIGHVRYYVHERFNVPLVVIDDDVSGTFTFVRALEEHASTSSITSREVGQTWLNQVINLRTIFWWGGHGISTEHTAYNNLKHGIVAPESGSMDRNGQTIAEQIGAQIFIDGWAMAAPGNPSLAAKLSEAAARVSHDGVAVDAAVLWAVMEAEAFRSSDTDHLLDTGLSYIPSNSTLRPLISDVRSWVKQDGDWEKTRQRIEDNYGYDKYHGICHVIPNHGIMIMALLYAGNDFSEAMHIINTSGWDTDCNSGNVGCLVAIMNGLEGFENNKGLDWRGPLADRALISSADGGYSINDAVRLTYDIADTARRLAGEDAIPRPKGGAQWHFSLPGSVQGFQSDSQNVRIAQDLDNGAPALRIDMEESTPRTAIEVSTQTFTPRDALAVKRDYDMMACPLLYPGQTLTVVVSTPSSTPTKLIVRILLKAYDFDDTLSTMLGPPLLLGSGTQHTLTYSIPSSLENKPIQQVGLSLQPYSTPSTLFLHSMKYSGAPNMMLTRPPLPKSLGSSSIPETMWQYQWVSSMDMEHTDYGLSFFLAQNPGQGLIYTGTRDWTDYRVTAEGWVANMGDGHGVVVRVQGLNRWYGVVLCKRAQSGYLNIVKAQDGNAYRIRQAGAKAKLDWALDTKYTIIVQVKGNEIVARVGDVEVRARDDDYKSGAAGFRLLGGSIRAESLRIEPVI